MFRYYLIKSPHGQIYRLLMYNSTLGSKGAKSIKVSLSPRMCLAKRIIKGAYVTAVVVISMIRLHISESLGIVSFKLSVDASIHNLKSASYPSKSFILGRLILVGFENTRLYC